MFVYECACVNVYVLGCVCLVSVRVWRVCTFSLKLKIVPQFLALSFAVTATLVLLWSKLYGCY